MIGIAPGDANGGTYWTSSPPLRPLLEEVPIKIEGRKREQEDEDKHY